ncbi:uncharacterized protein RJT21DRAFT_120226 [Scheffersomyces amazonensis]|uniref:uncharacterized protein n=1 Tax=Scheffersomyces amazonensis TaxID=1078765 RepID=UPI00315D55FB
MTRKKRQQKKVNKNDKKVKDLEEEQTANNSMTEDSFNQDLFTDAIEEIVPEVDEEVINDRSHLLQELEHYPTLKFDSYEQADHENYADNDNGYRVEGNSNSTHGEKLDSFYRLEHHNRRRHFNSRNAFGRRYEKLGNEWKYPSNSEEIHSSFYGAFNNYAASKIEECEKLMQLLPRLDVNLQDVPKYKLNWLINIYNQDPKCFGSHFENSYLRKFIQETYMKNGDHPLL